MVKAVRGAISLDIDSEEELIRCVDKLFNAVIEKNNIAIPDIISIVFSQTADISYNPAKALRISNNLNETPLFCTQEPVCVDFTQKKMLRFLLSFNCIENRDVTAVYFGNAASLRDDIPGNNG